MEFKKKVELKVNDCNVGCLTIKYDSDNDGIDLYEVNLKLTCAFITRQSLIEFIDHQLETILKVEQNEFRKSD